MFCVDKVLCVDNGVALGWTGPHYNFPSHHLRVINVNEPPIMAPLCLKEPLFAYLIYRATSLSTTNAKIS